MTSLSLRSSGEYLVIALALLPAVALGQGTLADYQRARDLEMKARGLVIHSPGQVTWIHGSDHFWYPRSARGGYEFVLVDAARGSRKAAFDQEKLAAAISSATGKTYTALALPFAPAAGGRAGGRGQAGSPPQTAPGDGAGFPRRRAGAPRTRVRA